LQQWRKEHGIAARRAIDRIVKGLDESGALKWDPETIWRLRWQPAACMENLASKGPLS
jgi:hypothetical protein